MKLQKNDLVALVSPAGFLSENTVVEKAILLLKSWGLRTIVGNNALEKQGYFAGTDEQRFSDFQTAIDNPEVEMIWALRGGYGTNRILDKLDFSYLKKYPKIVAGFSDITLIHNKLNKLNIPSYHTFMPVNLKYEIPETVIKQTKSAFFNEHVSYSFPFSKYNKNIQETEGIVIGGNLAVLYSTLGTNWDMDYDNKILFIEDVGEELYKIDRMIIALKQAEKLKGLKSLMVGYFSDIQKNDYNFGKTYQEIILEHTKNYSYPIIFNVPVGHEQKNYPLILGKKLKIKPGEKLINIYQ